MNLIDIEQLKKIALGAGERILEIYQHTDFTAITESKADNSPLTLADKASHDFIADGLTALYPDIPVFSEEGRQIPYDERRDWPRFWLVDPLDGTKEFLKRNGEFTVNIALVEGQTVVLGAVYATRPESCEFQYSFQCGAKIQCIQNYYSGEKVYYN